MKSTMSNEDVLGEMSKVESEDIQVEKVSEEKLEEYLISHPEFIQKWLQEKVSPQTVHKLLNPSVRKSESKNHLSGSGSGSPLNYRNNSYCQESFVENTTVTKSDEVDGESESEESKTQPHRQSFYHGMSDEDLGALQRSQARSKRNSITSDRFQSWLSTTTSSPKHQKRVGSPTDPSQRPHNETQESLCDHSESERRTLSDSNLNSTRLYQLQNLNENELFIELVKDISNELNIDILCHKILVNVGFLTQADRCSLFLARGPQEQQYLIAKLFDVTIESEVEESLSRAESEEIRIPFGVGIAGHVAQMKEVVNIKDAYKDSRFSKEVDSRTGYKTCSILALPICNNEGDVIGVAQVINKKTGNHYFTSEDIEVFQRYLTFCGIGIQNAQLFETSVAEYRKNQLLLNLARSIFEEQTSLERLVSKIMKEAQDLLKCERSLVYLRDVPLYEASQIEKILMMPSLPSKGERKPLCRRELELSGSITNSALHSEDSIIPDPNQIKHFITHLKGTQKHKRHKKRIETSHRETVSHF